MFIIELPLRFILALLGFTFFGLIGWLGLLLIGLKFFHVITWPWWVATLPLAYGVLYCIYMTIDGAFFRAGLKGVGAYARYTSGLPQEACGKEDEQKLEEHRIVGEIIASIPTLEARRKEIRP
jgi:hypothetical protein